VDLSLLATALFPIVVVILVIAVIVMFAARSFRRR
jgi:hypothetical protein